MGADTDPYFEPEWCERCGREGHCGLRCPHDKYIPDPDEMGDDPDWATYQ